MENSDSIKTVLNKNTYKIKEKGSQFLGFVFPIKSVEDANEELLNIKKEFYDATHHCYAYKLNIGEEKYSDDGEPNGTAGLRIYNAINHFELNNVLVVVVRYFGGTKLGVGPLGKAYYNCAFEVLDSSKKVELTKFEKIEIKYNYEDVSKIHYLINKFKCEQILDIFDNYPKITCFIQPIKIANFEEELTNNLYGKAELKVVQKTIYLNLK